jgi:hypothetical protein
MCAEQLVRPKCWLVRISLRKPDSIRDYNYLLQEIETSGQGLWDKDVRNQVRTGDYVAFIVGSVEDAEVHIFQVVEERPVEARHSFWSQSAREVIVLVKAPFDSYSWNLWRAEMGYAPNFWPNGTMPARMVPDAVFAKKNQD